MKDKKVVTLMVLAVLALLSLAYGLSAPVKGRGRVTGNKGIDRRNSSLEVSFDKNVASVKRDAKRTAYETWPRNPFSFRQPAMKDNSKFVLNGILWDNERPQAIINNDIINLGDEIGGFKVITINEDSVVLNDGGNDIELKLR